VALKVLEPRFPDDQMTCRIVTPFFSRPFLSKTFVLNPDQSAVLFWEETEYTAPGKGQGQNRSSVHVAQLLHEFSDVDYEFALFPPTLTVKEHERVKKSRIEMVPGLNGRVRLQLVMSKLDDAGQLAYARRRLALDPSDSVTLNWFVSRVPTEEALTLLRSGLGDRPLNVEWHRDYQVLMEEDHPEHDLVPEYRKLVQDSQRTPEALYLLGRILDGDESKKLLEEAARAPLQSAHALSSLGFRNLAAGRFKEAVVYGSKASPQVALDSREFANYLSALVATGAHDQVLTHLQQMEQMPDLYWYAKSYRVKDLAARGDDKAARLTIDEVRSQNVTEPHINEAIAHLQTVRNCGLSNVPGYLAAVDPNVKSSSFWVLLLEGKLAKAAENVVKDAHEANVQHALLYLYASKKNDKDLAAAQWKLLLEALEHGGRDRRFIAKVLTGAQPVDFAELRELPIDPGQKRVLLAVVAQRFPSANKEIAALARRLDFDRDEVSLCLKGLAVPEGPKVNTK
jgi:tetratricopeptide (TPR) repeat protein